MIVEVAVVAAYFVVVAHGLGEPVYRLPKTVLPTQYKLSLETDPSGYTFSGQVVIFVTVKDDTNNITLHSKNLSLKSVKLLNYEGFKEIPSIFSLEPKGDVLVIQSDRTLQTGGAYIVDITFQGHLTQLKHGKPNGYIRVSTGPTESDWMSTTAFEMVAAREAFPCFDEPQFKARFLIALIHNATHKALSNMPLINSKPAEKEGWVISHFENTPLMSSYLVTFQILQWESIRTKADDGRPLRLWADPKNLPSAQDHLDFARAALAWLQEYTQVPEPMPKIDLVAVPGFPGAIENWGDISFGPGELMHESPWKPFDEEVATIAHELAHSWFGNLVTPLWWDSLWLSEGAATFFSALAVEKIAPGHSHLQSKAQLYYKITYYMNLEESEPLSKPYNYMEDLLRMPNNVYYHGFALFYMLYESLGPEHFKAGIRRYLSGLQHNNTTPRKLYDALDYHWEGKDLYELMEEWTYQGGFPVVKLSRADGKLTLTQEHFGLSLSEDRNGSERENIKWWVPISFTTKSQKHYNDTRPKLWVRESTTIPDPADPDEWIILNNKASGLYIVQYDKATLNMIKKSLATPDKDGIPETMREKIFFDFELLALKGEVETIEIWEMHELLAHEKADGPWHVAMNVMRKLQARLRGTPAADMLMGQMKRLLEEKRVPHRNTDLMESRIGRSACFFGLPECIHTSSKLFNQWIKKSQPDKTNPIPSELKPVVYCSAMRSGKSSYWDFLLERALKSENSNDRDSMFIGLGCIPNYSELYKLLANEQKEPTMTDRDWTHLLGGHIRHNQDVGLALAFIKKALHTLHYSMGTKLRLDSSLLRELAEQIVEAAQLQEFIDMMNDVENPKGLTGLSQMVKRQIQWKKRNSHIVYM